MTSPPRWLAVAVPVIVALAGRAMLLPVKPIPNPRFHDEFSYLLAADTFAHGRLTNPTPPCWEHIESFHILVKPTYMSMYPPAQGLMLALGQAVFGHPWWGVWLSVGVMCCAAVWAMLAWLPPWWAMCGGLLAAIEFGLAHYWMNTYWGGAVAATGGCLLLGGVARLERGGWRWTNGLAAGAGLVILAASRPWEGLVFSVPVVLWALYRLGARWRSWLVFGLPCAAVVIAGGAALMFYFSRVTGHPLVMPHAANQTQYSVVPPFIWQTNIAMRPFRHEVMRRYAMQQILDLPDTSTLGGWAVQTGKKIRLLIVTYCDVVFFFILLITAPILIQRTKPRLLMAFVAVSLIALSLQRYYLPHYYAPVFGVMFTLQTLALRRACHWFRRRMPFRAIALGIVVASGAFTVGQQAGVPAPPFATNRAAIQRQLEGEIGKHLVVVRYSPDHNLHQDWVYNRASIEDAKVVWAREVPGSSDLRLIECFPGRKLWLLEPDVSGPDGRPQPVSR